METLDKDELKRAKAWFGDGEYDVDLMIAMGAVTEQQVLEMYRRENNTNSAN